jgi:FMN phosphatase YigB (HAD superfamily)
MIQVLLFDLAKVFLFPKDNNYKGGINDLYDKLNKGGPYDFNDYYYLYEEQLDFVNSLKNNYRLGILTSGKVQNDTSIKSRLENVFTDIFSAEEIGISKVDPKLYKLVAGKLGVHPEEIFFTDDFPDNVNAAIESGMHAVLYTGIDKLKKDLEELI